MVLEWESDRIDVLGLYEMHFLHVTCGQPTLCLVSGFSLRQVRIQYGGSVTVDNCQELRVIQTNSHYGGVVVKNMGPWCRLVPPFKWDTQKGLEI